IDILAAHPNTRYRRMASFCLASWATSAFGRGTFFKEEKKDEEGEGENQQEMGENVEGGEKKEKEQDQAYSEEEVFEILKYRLRDPCPIVRYNVARVLNLIAFSPTLCDRL